MATELTRTAEIKSQNKIQLPQLVLQIDGVPTVFGVGNVKKFAKIGDPNLFIDGSWKIGGLNSYEDQLDVVDINGSSNTISQQLLQDKGGTSSVPTIQVSLIDKNGKITELITPGLVVEDVLGRKANVYLGYQETAWPQDFVRIFSGVIDEVVGGSTIVLNVAHPEQKKRFEIFQKITTKLTTDCNYRASRIQKILYQTRRDVVGTVTVTYIGGATVGNEIVSVFGTNIQVQIEPGVTKAKHIRDKIEKSIDAVSLVEIRVDSGFSDELQTTQPTTSLLSDTTINVESTKGMLLPSPSNGFRTYVKIDDEVIEYTGLTATTITGCVRSAFELTDERSEGASHRSNASCDTFYRLQGSGIELALKVLMSGGPYYFIENVPVKSIVAVEGVGDITNAVWFENLNIQDAYGLTIGDKATIVGDANPANNVTDALIQDIVSTPYGSYIVLSGVGLVKTLISTATISFNSKWNVLPAGAGLGLGGDEVDVPEFERLQEIFASSIFEYDFYLKDSVNGKDFVDTEILFPTGAFTLPRRGKVSMGYTSPPLGVGFIKTLDSKNTTKPEQNKIKRSINKNFYNNVLFKYNEAVVDERFLSGDLDVSQDSKNRIQVGNKTLVISARGVRPSSDTSAIIELLKQRFSNKYKFGAETITTSALYGPTFDTDVGDVVIFGDNTLKIPDTKKGSRAFAPRLFEVSNKSLSIKSGEVKLELIDSGYSLADGRYGVISPSSLTVAAGSSGNEVKIKNSFETVAPRLERQKWNAYIGQTVLIHDENWDNLFETILTGFSPSDDYVMILQDTVPFAVLDDYVVDIAPYPDSTNAESRALSKQVFVFTNATVAVTSGVSSTQFNVALADADKFLEGAILLVRDTEWDVLSPEVKVQSVAGTLITVSTSLGFTPLAGYEIDFIGYKDGGSPYRYI